MPTSIGIHIRQTYENNNQNSEDMTSKAKN